MSHQVIQMASLRETDSAVAFRTMKIVRIDYQFVLIGLRMKNRQKNTVTACKTSQHESRGTRFKAADRHPLITPFLSSVVRPFVKSRSPQLLPLISLDISLLYLLCSTLQPSTHSSDSTHLLQTEVQRLLFVLSVRRRAAMPSYLATAPTSLSRLCFALHQADQPRLPLPLRSTSVSTHLHLPIALPLYSSLFFFFYSKVILSKPAHTPPHLQQQTFLQPSPLRLLQQPNTNSLLSLLCSSTEPTVEAPPLHSSPLLVSFQTANTPSLKPQHSHTFLPPHRNNPHPPLIHFLHYNSW